MGLDVLRGAIEKHKTDAVVEGRQEHGYPTPEQVREARSLGIETHGMNAKSIQDAIEAKKSGADDPHLREAHLREVHLREVHLREAHP